MQKTDKQIQKTTELQKEFLDFVEKAIEEPSVNRYEKIDEFCCDLYILFEKAISWLQEYIDKGQIVVKSDRAWFFEDHWDYKLPSQRIKVGNKEILLDPHGVDFTGKEPGKLSMRGAADTVYLSLQHPGGSWKVADIYTLPEEYGKELDKETFFRLLMRICTG
jgi:hypothetical protein